MKGGDLACMGCCFIPLLGGIPLEQQIFNKQDTAKQDTTKSMTKKWGIGIDYSGGSFWTGDDLARPFEASPIAGLYQLPDYLVAHLYWLNSLDVYFSYLVYKNLWVEVGGAYGWAEIENDNSLTNQFGLYSPWLGFHINRHSVNASYIYAQATRLVGIENIAYYYGNGYGFKISYIYHMNKFFVLSFNLGTVSYIIIHDDSESKCKQLLNGLGLSIGYQF